MATNDDLSDVDDEEIFSKNIYYILSHLKTSLVHCAITIPLKYFRLQYVKFNFFYLHFFV